MNMNELTDINSDELRRQALDSQRTHDQSMPAMRSALTRLFDTEGATAAEHRRQLALGGWNRRGFLKIGGAVLLGTAVMAACGDDSKSTAATTGAPDTTGTPTTVAMTDTTAAAASVTGDALTLRTASSIEELAVAVYQTAIDSGLVKTAAVAETAKLFQAQHKEHSALFQSLTQKAGGTPYTTANPAILASIKPTIDALKDEAGILALAFQLESVAAQTYQANVGSFTDATLNAAIMTVGGVEARHVAIFAGVLGKPQVPAAFQVTDLATKPGTGV
jgi:rubrerythrin